MVNEYNSKLDGEPGCAEQPAIAGEDLHALDADLATARAERDEADRRAGAAEREKARLEGKTSALARWLSDAKAKAGYHDSVSFDVVWENTLNEARRYQWRRDHPYAVIECFEGKWRVAGGAGLVTAWLASQDAAIDAAMAGAAGIGTDSNARQAPIAAAAAAAGASSEAAPYPPALAAELERTDWTPEAALRFYADGKHFDIVDGRTRVIDTGAIASNALKRTSRDYAEMKGDVALLEAGQAEATPTHHRE